MNDECDQKMAAIANITTIPAASSSIDDTDNDANTDAFRSSVVLDETSASAGNSAAIPNQVVHQVIEYKDQVREARSASNTEDCGLDPDIYPMQSFARVKDFSNEQLNRKMTNYEEDAERGVPCLVATGNAAFPTNALSNETETVSMIIGMYDDKKNRKSAAENVEGYLSSVPTARPGALQVLHGQPPEVVDDDTAHNHSTIRSDNSENIISHGRNETTPGAFRVAGPSSRNAQLDTGSTYLDTIDGTYTQTLPASGQDNGETLIHQFEGFVVGQSRNKSAATCGIGTAAVNGENNAHTSNNTPVSDPAIIEGYPLMIANRRNIVVVIVAVAILLSALIGVSVSVTGRRDKDSANNTTTPEGTVCFETTEELREAVVAYLDGDTSVRTTYGDPIGSWCVGNIKDFSLLFCAFDFREQYGNGTFINPGAKNFNEDITQWNTSSAKNMSSMFEEAEVFNQDLSKWDVSSVTDMFGMFYNAKNFNGNLSSWDVSAVTNMSFLFGTASAFDQDIAPWDVSSVTNTSYMFYFALSFNGNVTTWNVTSVTDMTGMFNSAIAFDQDLSSWDVSSVTTMYSMFLQAEIFNRNLSLWHVSAVRDMGFMFNGAKDFNGNISLWNVAHVNDTSYMFYEASSFNQDLDLWDVSSVTTMQGMFFFTESYNGNVTTWNVTSVTDMIGMFNGAIAFDQDLSSWKVSSVTAMRSMFYGAEKFNRNLSLWDVSAVRDMNGMFIGAKAFNGNISLWNVSHVNDTSFMFYEASSFNQDLSSWDVSSITAMQGMFFGAESYNGNVTTWNVTSVTDMLGMFIGAEAFDQDISMWDVSSVISMRKMFYEAKSFNRYISLWNVSAVTDMEQMFGKASNFNQNLCSWGSLLSTNGAITTDMFDLAQSCPTTISPNLTIDPAGPFCHFCVLED